MPQNFYIIIALQLAVFVSLAYWHKDKIPVFTILLWGIISGGVLGFFFDLLCGVLGIHWYLLSTPDISPFCACGLSLGHLLLNGFLSYGLAMATAYYLIGEKVRPNSALLFNLKAACYIILISAISVQTIATKGSMVILFSTGFIIVMIGELLMLYRGYVGPIFAPFVTHDIRSFLRSWITIIIIAILYETVNHYFPFWYWLKGEPEGELTKEFMIIVFAYAGLFHPMIIFWQVMRDKITRLPQNLSTISTPQILIKHQA